MKAALALLILCLCAGALFVPIGGKSFWTRANEKGLPRAAAQATAHGLRAGWDFIAGLGHREPTADKPAHSPAPPKHVSRAQAAAAQPAQRRASREGIVAQPPKERLEQTDRAALDQLVARQR